MGSNMKEEFTVSGKADGGRTLQLVILDTGNRFLAQLEEEILRRYADRIAVQMITEEEYATEFFGEGRSIDVLLTDKDEYSASMQELSIRRILLLASEVDAGEIQPDHVEVIMKYVPLGEIFQRIDLALQGFEGSGSVEPEEEKKHNTRMIAVYSPIGGCGKSLVAYALARKLRKLDQKVLLVGCDPSQSIGVFFPAEAHAREELAEKLIRPDDETYWTILKNIEQDEISYLLPFEKNLPTLDVGMQQWELLLTVLGEKQDFDYIILDVGTVIDHETASVLAKASFLILLTETNQIANRKMQKLLQDSELLPKCECFLVANEFRSDGLRIAAETVFGTISPYQSWEEALDDPVFYQIALKITE